MSLLSRPKLSSDGCYQNITPKSANWEYVGFQAHELAPQQTLNWINPDKESCLVILSGKADIRVDKQTFHGLGDRMSVFEDKKPHAVYAVSYTHLTLPTKRIV